jgi:tetratricopeptide (TPR) repeat protein
MLAQAFHARAWMTIARSIPAGLEDAEQAVSLARDIGEDQLLARMSVALVPILVVLERFDEEQQVFEQAYRAAERAGDEWVQGRLALNHGFGLWVKAESASDELLEGADRWFDVTLRHFTTSGVQLGLAHTLTQKGVIARAFENYQEAIAFFEKANQLFDTLGDREGASFNECHIAIALLKAGDPDAALKHVTSGATVLRELGLLTLPISGIEATVRADTGDFAGAVEALQGGSDMLGDAEREQVAIFGLHVARLANSADAYEEAAKLAVFASGVEVFAYGIGSLAHMVSEQVNEELDRELPTWREISAAWEERSVTDVIQSISSVLDRLAEET